MIPIKEPWELSVMRTAGRKLAEVVAKLRAEVAVDMPTIEIDRLTEAEILKVGARPAFKGYKVGKAVFPASICISINEQVVHGIPGKRRIREGDVLSLDFGLVYGGYYADTAFTVIMGEGDERSRALVTATEEALALGIAKAVPGGRVGDIGHAIESYVRPQKMGVVTQMVGHGIGRKLHEPPSVPNYGKRGTGDLLKAGMVIAVEPMITLGTDKTKILGDQWTTVTEDNSRAAHFEHTVAITPAGPEILTKLG
ncbi:MAG: type I methionyl aminopeptidase [Deltaproteobacteria bacterium]|nr:type I methionyl aminopeptidase [Deltaproteobacteria bacterium]